MRIIQQSSQLREVFQNQVQQKISKKQATINESLGGGFLGALGIGVSKIEQFRNGIVGQQGEYIFSLVMRLLPDTWVMCRNALIPAQGYKLTEVDCLIIGSGGVFLIEIKSWQGSFSAYKDKWKRREGNLWVAMSNSPTAQSHYHQKMFEQWISPQLPELSHNCIQAPVVFPIAKWIGVTNCSVPVYRGLDPFIDALVDSPNLLSQEQVNQISQLIEHLSTSKLK